MIANHHSTYAITVVLSEMLKSNRLYELGNHERKMHARIRATGFACINKKILLILDLTFYYMHQTQLLLVIVNLPVNVSVGIKNRRLLIESADTSEIRTL